MLKGTPRPCLAFHSLFCPLLLHRPSTTHASSPPTAMVVCARRNEDDFPDNGMAERTSLGVALARRGCGIDATCRTSTLSRPVSLSVRSTLIVLSLDRGELPPFLPDPGRRSEGAAASSRKCFLLCGMPTFVSVVRGLNRLSCDYVRLPLR